MQGLPRTFTVVLLLTLGEARPYARDPTGLASAENHARSSERGEILFSSGCAERTEYTMESFEEIYQTHVAAVLRYSVRCVGRREIAEEIASEAFLALYRNRDHVDETQLPAWLLTVVKRRAADYWRRWFLEQRHVRNSDVQVHPSQTERAAALPGPSPTVETWLAENKELKPVHRTCLILRYVHGMSRAEVAQKIGISDTQVKGYLQYALELLRKEFGSGRGEK
jgi:RNA polymerase sigma-70 factor (ECF subfamily)